jgi:hypothetical protein
MRRIFVDNTMTAVLLLTALILTVSFIHRSTAHAQGQGKKSQASATPIPAPGVPAPTTVRALTKEENEKWTILFNAESVYNGTINRVIQDAVRLALNSETSRDVHSAIKDANSTFTLSMAERRAFLAQLRLDADCKECIVLNGNLVRPAPETPPIAEVKK